MTTDPLVQSTAEALLRTGSLPLDAGERAFAAEVAVAAVVPLLRAQIAAEIRADRDRYCRAQHEQYRNPTGEIWGCGGECVDCSVCADCVQRDTYDAAADIAEGTA